MEDGFGVSRSRVCWRRENHDVVEREGGRRWMGMEKFEGGRFWVQGQGFRDFGKEAEEMRKKEKDNARRGGG